MFMRAAWVDWKRTTWIPGKTKFCSGELVLKEKALAEAAALLVLQKKFQALWEGKEN
jgi:hypothetical protein